MPGELMVYIDEFKDIRYCCKMLVLKMKEV